MDIEGNYLRYELRYKRRIAKQLEYKDGITLRTLYDSRFCDYMRQRYYDFYNSIKKMNEVTINPEKIKTVSDGFEVLVSKLLNSASPNEIEQYIDELKRLKVYERREDYSRLKTRLCKIAQRQDVATTNSLISELDNKVYFVAENTQHSNKGNSNNNEVYLLRIKQHSLVGVLNLFERSGVEVGRYFELCGFCDCTESLLLTSTNGKIWQQMVNNGITFLNIRNSVYLKTSRGGDKNPPLFLSA